MMEEKPVSWWNRPLRWPQAILVYAGAILFWQLVKAAFPEATKAFADAFGLPILIILIVFVAYRLLTLYVIRPRRRP